MREEVKALRVCVDVGNVVYRRIEVAGEADHDGVDRIAPADTKRLAAIFRPIYDCFDICTDFCSGEYLHVCIVQNVQKNAMVKSKGVAFRF